MPKALPQRCACARAPEERPGKAEVRESEGMVQNADNHSLRDTHLLFLLGIYISFKGVACFFLRDLPGEVLPQTGQIHVLGPLSSPRDLRRRGSAAFPFCARARSWARTSATSHLLFLFFFGGVKLWRSGFAKIHEGLQIPVFQVEPAAWWFTLGFPSRRQNRFPLKARHIISRFHGGLK